MQIPGVSRSLGTTRHHLAPGVPGSLQFHREGEAHLANKMVARHEIQDLHTVLPVSRHLVINDTSES